ncbi:MAG: hypothetical protein R2698_01940 [Microthrixaceae bacterium]
MGDQQVVRRDEELRLLVRERSWPTNSTSGPGAPSDLLSEVRVRREVNEPAGVDEVGHTVHVCGTQRREIPFVERRVRDHPFGAVDERRQLLAAQGEARRSRGRPRRSAGVMLWYQIHTLAPSDPTRSQTSSSPMLACRMTTSSACTTRSIAAMGST